MSNSDDCLALLMLCLLLTCNTQKKGDIEKDLLMSNSANGSDVENVDFNYRCKRSSEIVEESMSNERSALPLYAVQRTLNLLTNYVWPPLRNWVTPRNVFLNVFSCRYHDRRNRPDDEQSMVTSISSIEGQLLHMFQKDYYALSDKLRYVIQDEMEINNCLVCM